MQLADRVSGLGIGGGVTVQVFTITMSADAEPLAAQTAVAELALYRRCIRLVARQPNCSM